MTIPRTLAAALAAAAIAAPAASAEPAAGPASFAQAPERQDLRGEHARDAAIHPEDAPQIHSKLAPVSPGHPSEAANTTPLPPVDDAPVSAADDGVDWPTLGLGIAGLVLFMGGVLALATRTRSAPRTRVSA